MKLARRLTAVLTLSVMTSLAGAQQSAPTAAAPPAANPVDPASIQALKDMGAFLQTLDRFQAKTSLTGERVLKDGQKLMHMASATVDAQRPNKLRARMWSARSERELVYDGKTVTLYAPAQKYYSAVEFSEPVSALVDKLEERYGVEIPMADLFTWGTPAAPVDAIESAMNAGQDFVANTLCDHYAFRQGGFDWQIWIATGAQPLPRKVVITNLGDEARPQSVSVIDWNLKPAFNESTFRFVPPQGATRIEIVPVKR
ncbi:hypothetical protein VAR608DRAFT_2985 [Variovorax sp. HW608]|uniref:DUF2092 domain-containing protein n=1 Tax=Variovorax sp. HW608 TaxID=1034889 RepID=UPI00081F891D|nr:DUF2092 domain-containing protein [Variovorax sp. HW608]SCK33655.1 hypothetical protein VAR608DRAFT_2985 [Variovorax sp. HW608]